MDLTGSSIAWILIAAFGIGALHALEPGHGKSIMGAYLVASHGGTRHAMLLGLVVTVTHTIAIFLLAAGALLLADRFATEQVSFWLELVSGVLVLGVGLWMLRNSFGLLRSRKRSPAHTHPHRHGHDEHDHAAGHPHPHEHDHDHEHAHEHEHPHTHDHPHEDVEHVPHPHSHEVRIPEGKNPLGTLTLIAVGASGGLVPCPAALAALLAAIHLGRPATGIAVVAAMSLGIASTLIAIGIVFVQAGRWASRVFGSRSLMIYAPRVSSVLITVLGVVLLGRLMLSHAH